VKTEIQKLLAIAVARVIEDSGAGTDVPVLEIERTRDVRHGHFASNVAMRLAKALQQSPRAIAEAIVAALPKASIIASTEIAGPGFINFRLTDAAFHDDLLSILKQAEKYRP
jgi:arginyl-tRNA synthetase